jgi:1,4-dihydroxy-2-naphthoate octaprenyltransferase
MAAQPEAPVREQPATASPLDRHASPVADTRRTTGRAVAALVLGIISIVTFLFWPVSITLGILAIVIGTMARTDARKMGYTNAGQAKAGLICGIVGIVLSIGFIVIVGLTGSH